MTLRALLFFVALSAPALAYLDPVTGNIIVQVVLAAFAAAALGYHNLKARVQAMLGKNKKTAKQESDESKATSTSDQEERPDESDKSAEATTSPT